MLVQRWGFLQTAKPQNISIKKIIAIVNSLAKLHNFCIEELDIFEAVPKSLASDQDNIITDAHGYVELLESDDDHGDFNVPTDLMNGGHHFEGVPACIIQNYERNHPSETLRRIVLHNFIVDGHWERLQR